ncbi:hypothetical protein LTR66_016793 [Elasticomyces elasticus]|nr:hypothetical protein LTR66_016793 [Elasticomyces elasticus]
MDDLEIDSLMMMEVISDLSVRFSIELPIKDIEQLNDLDSLVCYLLNRGCGTRRRSDASSDTSTPDMSQHTSLLTDDSDTSYSTKRSEHADHHDDDQLRHLASLVQDVLDLRSAPSGEANLADMGLDSLQAIELNGEIEKQFCVSIDLQKLDETSSFQDLVRMTGLSQTHFQSTIGGSDMGTCSLVEEQLPEDQFQQISASHLRESFDQVRCDFDKVSTQEGFANFWRTVHPSQNRLVLSYTAKAFRELGADLTCISFGQAVPKISVLEKHKPLLDRMHAILADGGYIEDQESIGYIRTCKAFELDDPQTLLKGIISDFPIHASEHALLDVTGSRLAECLKGKVDPLTLLFANKKVRQIVADVYDLAPMCRSATRLLAKFMAKAFPPSDKAKTFHFLEVGGGTGGTTRLLVKYLTDCEINFTYTFTDLSSALVESVKGGLEEYDCMRYATLDVEKEARTEHTNKYHAIVSTNCIHATRNATVSLANLRKMLVADGVIALVEFTHGLYWFDLVYGLLDGWWLFTDGRRHALANTPFWDRSLIDAGYSNVNWSDGDTPESRTLRLICGFNTPAGSGNNMNLSKRGGVDFETLTWKNVDGLDLCADIYYPSPGSEGTVGVKRPIGK